MQNRKEERVVPAYCFECDAHVHYSTQLVSRKINIKGVEVTYHHIEATCSHCGQEVFVAEIADQNTLSGHEAYRKALGVITIAEIETLLDKYDIGAVPLSKLLGWSPSTIHKQLTHIIPSKEKSDKLFELFDPEVMKKLLEQNGRLLSSVAYKKVEKALATNQKKQLDISDQVYSVLMTEATESEVDINDLAEASLLCGLKQYRSVRLAMRTIAVIQAIEESQETQSKISMNTNEWRIAIAKKQVEGSSI